MTILITGSSGKTASPLADALHATSHEFIIASRTGTAPNSYPAVRFDWLDESTYENPFMAAEARQSPITGMYIVPVPGHIDALTPVKPFIDLAKARGVKRFVLLSSSLIESGGPHTGKIHAYLQQLGVEWAVLKPTWFMGMFLVFSETE